VAVLIESSDRDFSRGSDGAVVPILYICNSRNADCGIDLESLDTAPFYPDEMLQVKIELRDPLSKWA
jgi:hypothetical protein